jgi:hypothetical protein
MYFDALTEDCEYLIIWNAQVSLQNIWIDYNYKAVKTII